jgi:hypothetical protein
MYVPTKRPRVASFAWSLEVCTKDNQCRACVRVFLCSTVHRCLEKTTCTHRLICVSSNVPYDGSHYFLWELKHNTILWFRRNMRECYECKSRDGSCIFSVFVLSRKADLFKCKTRVLLVTVRGTWRPYILLHVYIYIYIYIAAVYEVGDGPYWINWENAQVQSCPLARIGARPSKAGRGKAKRKKARKARQGECKTHNYPAKHNGTCL